MDIVLEEDIARALSTQFGFTYVRRFSKYNFPANLINLIRSDIALAHLVFALKLDAKTLRLAMSHPLDMALHNDLAF